MIEWLWPWVAALAPLPLLMRFAFGARERSQAALTVPTLQTFADVGEARTSTEPMQRWRLLLLWLVWALLLTAAARPQWTGGGGE